MEKKAIIVFIIIFSYFSLEAQQKPFYQEDFSGGKLPLGWEIPVVGSWDPKWIVTNEPYPGSYQYQQQAPPIASKSRGYHLQFQAGYFSDEEVDDWVKHHKYPDAYVISAPIDCSSKNSVILKFQQTFRWWNYKPNDTAGLLVGVSTDRIHWQEWDMRREIASATDMFLPLNEEINISKWAAHQPQLYIRFYWKGLQAWYWMIDDIELFEAAKKDIGMVRLVSHSETGNEFKADDQLRLKIRNNGATTITDPIMVRARVDGQKINTQIIDAAMNPLKVAEERTVVFPHINLSQLPVHQLQFQLELAGDEIAANNSLTQSISTKASVLGKITHWSKLPNGIELESGVTKVKLLFYKDNLFRIWLSPDGNYTNPAGDDIVLPQLVDKHLQLKITSDANNIYIASAQCKLQVQKNPILFSLFNKAGYSIWAEKSPLTFGAESFQQLNYNRDEYFFGGGMQNGYFSHKDSTILIEKGGGWNTGGRPNPAPFYMSSRGYGALRNTFDAGKYDFTKNMRLSHHENRFDCYYFVGPSYKTILNQYTATSGRPFMPARWQLSMGDANCYNKKGTTPDVIKLVADAYINNNMPRGWILPNDGYGCGYTKLDSTVEELHKRGFYTGLWTENGVEKIATEVGKYGTRLCKLDVAWVGPGYKYALDGCRAAYEGIENNSDARGFVWSVMGWAGTQRYSVVWTGDQVSSWEYIRFHIPTIIGSGLSAQNCATGDVDAIFGGSAKTYTRDLQWKCFTPVFMTMSGWAKNNKQPWIYGEPYTSINRKYLQLKMRLTPYMYSLMHEAHQTGTPAVRALLLEYPSDTVCLGKATQYQYLLGKSLLVAPVYKEEEKRDSIYLPEGKWIDYWDGTAYEGKKWINHYPAPLDKLPLFVKAGSIIPMYPQMNYDGEKALDTLSIDIYPQGHTSYQLYEDDGLTRDYKNGVFATTQIHSSKTNAGINITIDAIQGTYKNRLPKRAYTLSIHSQLKPTSITINQQPTTSWNFDAADRKGIIKILVPPMAVNKSCAITIQ